MKELISYIILPAAKTVSPMRRENIATEQMKAAKGRLNLKRFDINLTRGSTMTAVRKASIKGANHDKRYLRKIQVARSPAAIYSSFFIMACCFASNMLFLPKLYKRL
jgi:hypothetical protein